MSIDSSIREKVADIPGCMADVDGTGLIGRDGYGNVAFLDGHSNAAHIASLNGHGNVANVASLDGHGNMASLDGHGKLGSVASADRWTGLPKDPASRLGPLQAIAAG